MSKPYAEEDPVSLELQRLHQLENESVYILREAYRNLSHHGILWSMGKDSTVMLWLIRKAFFGKIPFPVLHIDTSFKIPQMIDSRDLKAKEWGLDLRIGQNKSALANGMGPQRGKLECCMALKSSALKDLIREQNIKTIFAAIRRDEEGSRGKEHFFSPRGNDSEWNYKEQPPDFWHEYQTEFPDSTEVRVHPLLHWTELDVWLYIRQQQIPVLELYFSKAGQRYRSVGCAPCTGTMNSEAGTLDEVIQELRTTKVSERAGRAQDQADRYALQKLRARGYM